MLLSILKRMRFILMGRKNHKLVMQLTFPAEFLTNVLSIPECIDPEGEFSFSEQFDFITVMIVTLKRSH